MDILEFRDFCLSLPHTEETTPFDETTLVMKVAGKMFAMADMVDFNHMALKCDPDRAVELRETYQGVTAAYHMNKKHWNDVSTLGEIPDKTIKNWIIDSYKLVWNSIPNKTKKELTEF